MLGVDKVKSYAQKLQIDYLNNDLSVALGNLSGGITLKELADAYSVFASNGNYVKSTTIDKIVTNKGKIIYQGKPKQVKVFDDSTVFLINDILKECAKSGTAKKLNDFSFDVCAKTGTNGNEKGNEDVYCVAYTTTHTVAVWLGYADSRFLNNSITL
jgi:membrane peptidoglycan carboxypeptidase